MLLDVNVCFAASWADHQDHEAARGWIDDAADDSLGICRITQLGWLRLLPNQSSMGSAALTRREAWEFVAAMLADSRFVYLDEPPDLAAEFGRLSATDDHAHKLWTDDYLAAFALSGDLELVTLDTKFESRYPGLAVLIPGRDPH